PPYCASGGANRFSIGRHRVHVGNLELNDEVSRHLSLQQRCPALSLGRRGAPEEHRWPIQISVTPSHSSDIATRRWTDRKALRVARASIREFTSIALLPEAARLLKLVLVRRLSQRRRENVNRDRSFHRGPQLAPG